MKENKSIFLDYFGDTPKLRVLDFLIDNHFFDYPLTEIARESNVSYNSLASFFPEWIAKGIIVKTRKVGKSDYVKELNSSLSIQKPIRTQRLFDYKFNLGNSFVRNLMKLDWSLTKKATANFEEKELLV